MSITRLMGAVLPLCLAAMLGVAGARADVSIQFSGGTVRVDAPETSSYDLLDKLADSGGFTVEKVGSFIEPMSMSVHYDGPIDGLIAKLLFDDNYLIEHDPKTVSGISRITMYGATDDSAPKATTATPAMPRAAAAASNGGPQPLSRQLAPDVSAPAQAKAAPRNRQQPTLAPKPAAGRTG